MAVDTMKRAKLLIAAAWMIHAVAWFLPVITDGVRFPNGLPGWEAFQTALRSVRGYQAGTFSGIGAVAATLSAVTTIFFILISPWVVLRGSRSVRRVSAWIAAASFLLDAHWYFFYGRSDSGLMIGYFLWWFSFLVLAIGLFDLAGWRGGAFNAGESA
jgi:hypothetical protein